MEFTRRGRGVAAVAGVLAALAVLLARPLLLGGAAAVGGWLLARQWRFGADAARAWQSLAVTQSPHREAVTAGETVAVDLTASLPDPPTSTVTVCATPPVGGRAPSAADRSVSLAALTAEATTTVPVTLPVAGRHAFGAPEVTVQDPGGLFATSFDIGTDASVTASPRAPRRVHVGEGGDPVGAFGEHGTGDPGPGLEPAELREYVPGDEAADIDWKATARLDEIYVREHEIETDRRTVLVVDHRATMGAGPPGERKLDYARAVALGALDAARRAGDPVGLVAVGDEGVTERVAPDTGDGHYGRLVRLLHDVVPTGGGAASGDEAAVGRSTDPGRPPAAARRAARLLADDESAFGRTLEPYFGASTTYVERVREDPLYAAVDGGPSDRRGAVVTLVLTDDERRGELRETLDVAAGGEGSAVGLLTPSALFDGERVADLDRAYDRYVDFESFRRELASRPGVAAYEVAPGARIDAVLTAGRARR